MLKINPTIFQLFNSTLIDAIPCNLDEKLSVGMKSC